jgi:hypothetical protein
VGAGQNSGDLDYTATNSLALSGGTIVSSVGSAVAPVMAPKLSAPAPAAPARLFPAARVREAESVPPASAIVVPLTFRYRPAKPLRLSAPEPVDHVEAAPPVRVSAAPVATIDAAPLPFARYFLRMLEQHS